MSFAISLDVLASSLAQVTSSGAEIAANLSIGRDPVGERILAILDDGLGSLKSIISSAGFSRCDRCVINELEEVLSEAGNDSEFLAVLAESIKLVGVGGLQLLTGNVRELCFGDKGLGFGSDELLFENDDLWRVRLLILQLCDLIRNLLFTYICN